METLQPLIEKLKARKEILFVAIPFGLVLLTIIFYLIFAQTNTVKPTQTGQRTPSGTDRQSPLTPNNSTLEKLKVSSVLPANNTTGVDIYTPIKVIFKQAIPANEQQKISFNISPDTQGTTTWAKDNMSLTYTPIGSFATDTQYTVTIVAGNNNSSWAFRTKSYDDLTEQEIIKGEEASAEYTKQQEAAINTKFPWIERFPLQKPKYFAYFDTDKEKFVGLLYPKLSESTSQDAQVSAMKTEIQTAIRNITTDVDKYGIEWKVTPEP